MTIPTAIQGWIGIQIRPGKIKFRCSIYYIPIYLYNYIGRYIIYLYVYIILYYSGPRNLPDPTCSIRACTYILYKITHIQQ